MCWARLASIAARSIWPGGAAAGLTLPGVFLLPPTGGRTALGTGGLPPTFGAGAEEDAAAPGLGPVIGGFGWGLLRFVPGKAGFLPVAGVAAAGVGAGAGTGRRTGGGGGGAATGFGGTSSR